MAQEKLLTVREVSSVLGISEREVLDLAEGGQIPAYKVGGVYLRFRKDQIEDFRKSYKHPNQNVSHDNGYTAKDKVSDFFYFNDFYILAILVVILIFIIIFKGY